MSLSGNEDALLDATRYQRLRKALANNEAWAFEAIDRTYACGEDRLDFAIDAVLREEGVIA